MMKDVFLDLLLESGALKFGTFKTKSGRTSPFFINTGSFDDGQTLSRVAECYADLIEVNSLQTNLHLFGPAYKGIALATSVAQEVSKRSGAPVPFTFNRKEVKDHGEGGGLIGRAVSASTELVVIEDVMTGGTSVRECLELLKSSGAKIRAVVIGVDRQERGTDKRIARQQMEDDFGIKVYSILSLDEVVEKLWNKPRLGRVWIDDALKRDIDAYRAAWS